MITELHDGTFYAEIELGRDGTTPPDLLAAVGRHRPRGPLPGPIPIFADEAVLEEAGVLFEKDEEEDRSSSSGSSSTRSSPEDFALPAPTGGLGAPDPPVR